MNSINNNIEETRVCFDNAKLLKKAGCKILPNNTQPTDYVWGFDYDIEDNDDTLKEREFQWEDSQCSHLYLRPTQQLVIDWIKINFNIDIFALPHRKECNDPHPLYFVSVIQYGDEMRTERWNSAEEKYFNSSKEAKEAAILYVLTNLIK